MIIRHLQLTALTLFCCLSTVFAVVTPSQHPQYPPQIKKIVPIEISEKENIGQKTTPKLNLKQRFSLKIIQKRVTKKKRSSRHSGAADLVAVLISIPAVVATGGILLAVLSPSIFLSILGILLAVIGLLALAFVIFLVVLFKDGVTS